VRWASICGPQTDLAPPVYGMGDMPVVQPSHDFGADDRLPCPECGGEMSLTHRSPHPDYGVEYEAQTFTCSTCLYELERTVNSAGEPYQQAT
jgi:C4-type Zn-finger protein